MSWKLRNAVTECFTVKSGSKPVDVLTKVMGIVPDDAILHSVILNGSDELDWYLVNYEVAE